jgi:predicted ATPase
MSPLDVSRLACQGAGFAIRFEPGSLKKYGRAISYLPIIDLLKRYFKVLERGSQSEIQDKVIGRLLGLSRTLEPLIPPILALLDVSIDDLEWAGLDPAQKRQRTLEAVKRLFLKLGQDQPLLLILEDLHWADAETQA